MRNLCFLPVLLVTAICAHELLFAQSDLNASDETASLTYHSNGSEVRLVFFATDEHHHSVTDIQKDDFAVVDDDIVIRNFRSFAPSAPLKLDVVVLLDASESVLPHFQSEVADVLRLLSQWPSALGDNLSLLSFSGTELHPICALECPASLAADRIASLPQGGPTPLFDAIDTASTLLMQRRQPETWPVIILLSDGQDTISRSSFRDASEKILASEAHVYAIDIGNGASGNRTATLQRLADDSGGRYVPVREGWEAALNNVLNSIVDDLHSARVVTYPLPDSGSDFHSVRILPTRNLAWQFHCRRGYFNHLSSAN